VQDPQPLNDPLGEFVENLRALQPAPARTAERDIWYQAGVKAGRRRTAIWRAASVAFAITTVSLLTWSLRPAAAPLERIVYVRPDPPQPPPQVAASSSDSYARLRDAILRNGLDGLPPPDFNAGGEPIPHHAHRAFGPDEGPPVHIFVDPRG
jgi:hypothetical protein